ncbi:Sacsin [Termitomyces sp. J132]|nr:Sacsin [Termitomyces sp. J132]
MAVPRESLWASGHDESVEVNQRALIDKVLARYSGEFTVFRELLQNSDDAQATAVEIHFDTRAFIDNTEGSSDTRPSKALPDLKTTLVHRWTFKNNGIIFRDEDWNRLKKIAEGNPDEEKIGAFGVGFYSLFSVTEEPFVTSGDQWMGFYWKDMKDQLFARRGQLPSSDDGHSPWTTFEMVLREPAPIPMAFDFTRFLASSITFMTYLSEVSFFFDDKRLTRLTKKSGISKELGLPKGLRTSTDSGIMTIKDIKCTPLHIQAEVMQWVYSSSSERKRPMSFFKPKATAGSFFSSLFGFAGNSTPQHQSAPLPSVKDLDPQTLIETSVALSIFSADVDVRLNKKISAELYRSTRKNPPNKLKYELIYTAKDEYDASEREEEQQSAATGSIFQGLRADLEGYDPSFPLERSSGHATGQTTGIGGHMAARFIPTVERESIDLMDRNVAIWNQELLYVGGFLARAAYEMEMETVKSHWEGSIPLGLPPTSVDQQLETWLRSRSLHALKFFTFHPSTPSAEVSQQLEKAFFDCAGFNFPLISTAGVRNASDLPMLPEDILADAPTTIGILQSRGLIKSIGFEDVLRELRSRPLMEDEMVACLKWWISINKEASKFQLAPRTQFLEAAILSFGAPDSNDEKIIPLSSIRSFINARTFSAIIPQDGPLPDDLLPPSIGKHFAANDLINSFPWTELSIPDWLGHICSAPVRKVNPDFNISLSAPWAERVLLVVAKSWPNLPALAKGEIYTHLKTLPCIPTSMGMKTPDQSYFAQANLFNDLPVVMLPSGSSIKTPLERVFVALGVRRHVDLQVVFNRMIKTNEWTVADLAKYLVSIQSTLSPEEWARLKMTAAFFKEENMKGDTWQKATRYQAQELYEPVETFRSLGLPVMDWGKQTKWRSSSDEAKFLFELGLIRYPPLPVLIDLCASANSHTRTTALKYLLDHIGSHYEDYDPSKYEAIAFIPAMRASTPCMGTVKEVFSNSDWAMMGFLVTPTTLQPDALSKLKIKQHPPTTMVVDLLERMPPKNQVEARAWFSVLGSRVSDFSSMELQRMSQMKIVPVPSEDGKSRWLQPTRCYFGGDNQGKFHSKLFVFVSFGLLANSFLTACGTKHEPSVEEVVQILLENPHKFFASAEGPAQFLAELRNIAVNYKLIRPGTIARMKKAPILLGSKRKPRKDGKKVDLDDFDEDDWEVQYDLRKAEDIIIANDTHALQAFGDSFFTAPQEDILEAFYTQLGSRRLSSLVKEEYQSSAEIKQSKIAAETRALILERLPLFLHEHSHARTRVSYTWLTSQVNFAVKTFGRLFVKKTLTFGDIRLSRQQEASAVATRAGNTGPIHLWIAGNTQIDMYEVATSLNRLIFDSPRANDALLFMTILSTDLKALKRRGYNVDRILRQQKAEGEGTEETKVENLMLLSKPPMRNLEDPAFLLASNPATPSSSPTAPPAPPVPLISKPPPGKPLSEAPKTPSPATEPLPTTPFRNSLNLFKWKKDLAPPPEPSPLIPPVSHKSPVTPTTDSHVTPLKNISSNIDMAIRACRPESGNLLRNRQEMRRVQESLDEGYCDVSGGLEDLNLIGEMGNVRIYLTQGVPDQKDFLINKQDLIARFIHILVKLSRVYDLPLTSLHVFYDIGGGLIAFNRNGSIFVNLRYYMEWHDKDVGVGNLNQAYISWFFTLAHEIAHNLVRSHNSEHEFYFSAICEKHVMNLGGLLL